MRKEFRRQRIDVYTFSFKLLSKNLTENGLSSSVHDYWQKHGKKILIYRFDNIKTE